MTVDLTRVILKDDRVSLKVIDVKTGTITAPATSSSASNEITIPHNLGNDQVVPYLTGKWSLNNQYVQAPYSTPDGRVSLNVSFDSTNVYITASSFTAGSPQPATDFDYTLFIAIP